MATQPNILQIPEKGLRCNTSFLSKILMRDVSQPDRHNVRACDSLGSLLKNGREALGLTQAQLAAQLGVTRPYLSRLERGEYANPSGRVLAQLANRLGIPIEDLYGLTGYALPRDLPNFGPYLRAKHNDWPEQALREIETFYEFVLEKYSLE